MTIANTSSIAGSSIYQKASKSQVQEGLSTQQQQTQVAKLQSIDTQVRAHEAAHVSAGGGVVTGGANLSYAKGPDGKMYAVAGEVPIDTSEGNSPEETMARARQIMAAALAPADPSPQDYKVASTAATMELRAKLDQIKEMQNTNEGEKAYAENRMQK